MATELTVKERAFAQLIIEGTKVAAYRKVYSDRGSVTTQTVNAYKFARKPKIKAEVARLLRQREFPADDYARIRDVAVAGLTEIFLQESDPRLRAKVGSVLLAYADAGLKLHPVPSTKEREYEELMALITVEAEKDRSVCPPEASKTTAHHEILGALAVQDEAPAKSAAEILAELRQEAHVKQQVLKPPAAETRYVEKLVSRPGHFPAKFVKVPARNPAEPEGA
jgi:hypothetical protein